MTIAVLGLGGAGGNMANEAAELGMLAGAINFSQKDLNSAESVKYKLKVPDSEGVGHDRELAIQLLQEHHVMVLDFIREHFGSPSCHVIAIPFATGGGSGAGMAPLLIELLQITMPDKVLVAVPIIPDLSEPTVSQSNTSATMAELLKLDVAILPVDNRKVPASLGKSRVYDETNKRLASHLFDLVGYTEKYSKNGNFDRTDLRNLFSQRGLACIADVAVTDLPKSDLSPEGLAATIQDSWASSIFAPIDYHHVVRAALIFDGQEALMGYIDQQRVFEPFTGGTPLDLFEGNYHDDKGRIITVLTGLPFCRERFELIDQRIEQASAHAELQKPSDKPVYESKAHSVLQLSRTPQRATSASQAGNVNDFLSRYNKNR